MIVWNFLVFKSGGDMVVWRVGVSKWDCGIMDRSCQITKPLGDIIASNQNITEILGDIIECNVNTTVRH